MYRKYNYEDYIFITDSKNNLVTNIEEVEYILASIYYQVFYDSNWNQLVLATKESIDRVNNQMKIVQSVDNKKIMVKASNFIIDVVGRSGLAFYDIKKIDNYAVKNLTEYFDLPYDEWQSFYDGTVKKLLAKELKS